MTTIYLLMIDSSDRVIKQHQATFAYSQEESETNPEIAIPSSLEQSGLPKIQQPLKYNDCHVDEIGQAHQQKQQPLQQEQKPSKQAISAYQSINAEVEFIMPSTMTPQPRNKRSVTEQAQPYEEHGESQLPSYHQLTMKIDSTIQRITTKKKPNRNKYDFQRNFMQRVQECQERKKKFIDSQKSQQQLHIRKTIQPKPTISQQSDQMIKKVGYQPIHKRADRVLEQRRKRQEEAQIAKRMKEEEEEMEILEHHKQKKQNTNQKDYDQYFQEITDYRKKKQEQNRIKQEQLAQKQLQGVTFAPTLNQRSEKLVASQPRVPIAEREPPVKKKSSPEYTFTPRILKKKK